MSPLEFDCIDCNTHIVSFGDFTLCPPGVCAVCSFLRTIKDETEREALRKHLLTPRKEK